MTAGETTRGATAPASPVVEKISPECRISASNATRDLSAAPHLRRGMLQEKIIGSHPDDMPPPPVGRRYALNFIFGAQRRVPMPAVDTGEVRGQCIIALTQTMIRDATAIAALIISALLEPRGTAIVFGLAMAVIVLIGRVRLFSLWTVAAAAAVASVLLIAIGRGDAQLDIPLICLGICYVVFLGDILLSVHYLRWLWNISSAEQDSRFADPAQGGRPAGAEENSYDGQRFNQQGFVENDPCRIYHDSNRIIGSGAPLEQFGFHVSLESRLDDDRQITDFKASELLDYIRSHVISQRASNIPENGSAFSMAGEARGNRPPRGAIYKSGLPYLRVTRVISVPVPKPKKHAILRFSTVRLNYDYLPSEDELLDVADGPQIGQDERYYVRVVTPSWKGQIVVTIYCYVAMEADSLNVTVYPYVLTPITGQVRIADDLVTENRFIIAAQAVRMAARQLLSGAQKINRVTGNGAVVPAAGLYSTRELYAGILAENTHQLDDVIRTIRVLEAKVVRVAMEFLRNHNIDPNEDEKRAFQSVHSYTINGDIINAGPNSQVNSAKGDNIKQANKTEKTEK